MKQTQKRPTTGVRARNEMQRHADSARLRQRHEQRRRKREKQIVAMRTGLMILFCIVLVSVILFMTPLFNIRKITVSGNKVITLEEINQSIGHLDGKNLFKVDKRDIQEQLSAIAYIKDVSINKNYFKTTLDVEILERQACGYLGLSGGYVLFDDECVILAKATEKPENIPLIIGIDDVEGENYLNMDEENISVMIDCLKMMRELNIIEKVDNLNVSDLTKLSFKYDGRLDVYCGTDIDLERKLRMFEAIVNNNNLADNAKGSVDLSVTGNARYTP